MRQSVQKPLPLALLLSAHTFREKGLFCCVLPLLLLTFLCSSPVHAATPKNFSLGSPALSMSENNISLLVPVGVDSLEGLRDMLRDGAIMELSIRARITRVRSFLPDVSIMEQNFTSLVRYNPLTREFSLTAPQAEQAIVDKNLNRLLSTTWQKLVLPLGSPDMFQAEPLGSEYLLLLNISLRHTEVPPWLTKAFLFWSWDVVTPEQLSISFIH